MEYLKLSDHVVVKLSIDKGKDFNWQQIIDLIFHIDLTNLRNKIFRWVIFIELITTELSIMCVISTKDACI